MNGWIVVAGAAALGVAAVWPGRGLLPRWREGRRLSARMRVEDALKHILKAEANRTVPSIDSIAGSGGLRRSEVASLLVEMEQRGLVAYGDGRLGLTPKGRELAVHVVRAHRLWESYLAEQTGVEEERWHELAERQEHLLSPQDAAALAARLGHPMHDPHGDVIPEPGGALAADSGQPLNAVAPQVPGVIAHIEDEPRAIFAQLSAQGLRPGMKTCVLEKDQHHVRFWADGREHVLAPTLANNIFVVPLPEVEARALFGEEFLVGLKPGQRATVQGLSPACRGAERRRLLDLGFVAGTEVAAEMVSPGGDPTAYRVRGTLIALRREQANLIRITTAAGEGTA
jgi:DtxR family transcriptional regulator, Mn-dependent transcriptional regulator